MTGKLVQYLKEGNYSIIFKHTRKYFDAFVTQKLKKFNFFSAFTVSAFIRRRKLSISRTLAKDMGNTVRYGFFKGFVLGKGYEWGKSNIWSQLKDFIFGANIQISFSMLLGLYETEVLSALKEVSAKRKTLIDLGAADGYFAVGCLYSKMFEKVYAFELFEKSQKNMRYNSELNKVSDQLQIFGKAVNELPLQLLNNGVDFSQSVIICDIEGGEFELFSDEVLGAFKNAVIIIEIHDWHEDGVNRFQSLQDRASKYFNITKLTTRSRDLSIFPELKNLNDDDRWLVCLEGRHYLMTWLRLDPKVFF